MRQTIGMRGFGTGRWLFSLLAVLWLGCSAKPDQELMAEVKGLPAGTYAVLSTNRGDIVARLFTEEAPTLVANFIGLAEGVKPFTDPRSGKTVKRPFYDGLVFFKTEPDAYIATGDPLNLGFGGPGYTLPPDYSNGLTHDRPGLLTMIRSEDSLNGSQFYITVRPTPEFNKLYCPFGEVVKGLEIAKEFSLSPRYRGPRPIRDMVIRKARVFEVQADGGIQLSPPPLADAYLMGPPTPETGSANSPPAPPLPQPGS